jgi:hypothetical protein
MCVSKHFCREHFNEHRDKLSTDLYNVFDHHDHLLQELQIIVVIMFYPNLFFL